MTGGHALAMVVGSDRRLGLAFWLAVILAAGVLEALARLTTLPVPRLGDLVASWLPGPVLRTAAVALWLFAGWHLFAH